MRVWTTDIGEFECRACHLCSAGAQCIGSGRSSLVDTTVVGKHAKCRDDADAGHKVVDDGCKVHTVFFCFVDLF